MAVKKIDIRKLRVGMSIASPIYKERDNRRILLLAENTLIINEGQIRRLIAAGIFSVEIDTEKGTDTFTTLLNQKKWEELAKTTDDPAVTEVTVARHTHVFITSVASIITSNMTSRALVGENRVAMALRGSMETVENNVDLLLAMIRLRGLNEYTYTHSVNVAILCISLGIHLGMDSDDVIRFGTGVLLADLGMTSYPSAMTRRPSGLSRQEREELSKHPVYTVEFLQKVGIEDAVAARVILQHHERFDGSGYPMGLAGEDISALARLFAIADVYDAMTSPRPHRSGIPPYLALAEILRAAGTLYDPEMAEVFIKHMGVFPVGSMVELTGGQFAIVAAANREDPLRPVVILLRAKQKLNRSDLIATPDEDRFVITLGRWELVNLSSRDGWEFGRIKRGLDHRKFHIKPAYYLEQV
ncbi:MAG: HD-GYP domain-containing protein [Candidatus Latescibacterota bacterium]